MRTAIALTVGLVLLALTALVGLLGHPLTSVTSNGVSALSPLALTRDEKTTCQSHETIPAGSSAMHLYMAAILGPHVAVTIASDGRTVARGFVDAGWIGHSVVIPIGPVDRTVADGVVCFRLTQVSENVLINGEKGARPSAVGEAGEQLGGRVKIDYLQRGAHSRLWWVPAIAQHVGLGKAPGGPSVLWLIGALMALVVLLACWMTLRNVR